jgi:hypothetical protein
MMVGRFVFGFWEGAVMLRFNLKTLFCLTLVVGVALMWVSWARGTDETANRLMEIRDSTTTMSHLTPFKNVWELLNSEDEPIIFGTEGVISPNEADLWMDCSVELQLTYDGNVESTTWHADWPAIEKKAREENGIFYCNIIVSVLATLIFGWMLLGRRFFGQVQ